MKKIYLLVIFCLAINLLQSQSKKEKYISSMETAIALMDSAHSIQQLQEVANRFERIGTAEKKEWLPWYYGAMCYATMVYREQDKSKFDGILDKAQEMINKADAIESNNSEIWVIKGMILGNRIMVDPQTRGMEFGPLAGQTYAKAKTLNPENPRALFFAGQNLFYTPKTFGGGKEKAIPVLKEAMAKFDTFTPESSIHPKWGKEFATEFMKQVESGDFPWMQEGNETEGDE